MDYPIGIPLQPFLISEQWALSFMVGEAPGSVRALSGSVTVFEELGYVSRTGSVVGSVVYGGGSVRAKFARQSLEKLENAPGRRAARLALIFARSGVWCHKQCTVAAAYSGVREQRRAHTSLGLFAFPQPGSVKGCSLAWALGEIGLIRRPRWQALGL